MEQLRLNHLAVFTAIAQRGSLTGAARALGMPKSTVSRWLGELEQSLGIRLVERSTRRLSLTDAGGLLLRRTERMLSELAEAQTELALGRDEPCGVLRITAPSDLGSGVLALLIAEFVQRYPAVRVVGRFTDATLDLVGEGIDVAVRAGRLSNSQLIARRIYDDERRLYASPSYLAAHPAPTFLQELAQHRLVTAGQHLETQWRLQRSSGEEQTVSVSAVCCGDGHLFVRRLLLAGAGIGFVPEVLVRADVSRGHLVRVLPEYSSLGDPVHLVYPSGKQLLPKVRVFLDFLAEHLGEHLRSAHGVRV